MKLHIKRSQDKGFIGGMNFFLEAKVELAPAEEELIKKYRAQKHILIMQADKYVYTIDNLTSGMKEKCKDVTIMLENEEVIRSACKNFKTLLSVMESFGGEEIIEF